MKKKKLEDRIGKVWQKIVDQAMGNGLMQEELSACSGQTYVTPEMSAAARRCAADACVLLENDGTLPLQGQKVAVFGRCQLDWFYVGYGSGGDVHPPYQVNLMEGLKNVGITYDEILADLYKAWCLSEENKADHGWWGHWPMSHPEMHLEKNVVADAASRCDTAIVVVGRAAGEDRENTLTPGSYYMTEEELRLMKLVTKHFEHVVVLLNIGSIMDLAWTLKFKDKISALMITWQGGMESGNAVADILSGRVTPSGHLTDTIAKRYTDYPSSRDFGDEAFNNYTEDIYVGYRYFDLFAKKRVLYPFGYGLSYTTFQTDVLQWTVKEDIFTAEISVCNTGSCAGREVVHVWCHAPQEKLGKAEKTLVAFGKTKLLEPGEKAVLTLSFTAKDFASFDDSGAAGFAQAFVLEEGTYLFTVNDTEIGRIDIPKTRCVEQCCPICAVQHPFERIKPAFRDGTVLVKKELVPQTPVDLRGRILDHLPDDIAYTGDQGIRLSDVKNGKADLERFIAQLNDRELEALTRGEGCMGSALGVPGNAGAFGGILPSLREKGIPPVITSDGPSGLRLQRYCGLLPSGTALASTWDLEAVEELFTHIGKEMQAYNVDVILSPGMNIHRNPFCGRNFEYFSEDPLLTGKMAAAVVRGVQSAGGSCCPKHFACNNQETKRNVNDSRVSVRALREIYLRGFEICVKEGKPHTLMTSYNKINGVWAHYNFDLVATVLRKEWSFDGPVVTDWWMRKSASPEFPKIRDNAYRVRAQVDVLMPGNMGHLHKKYHSDGTLLKTLGKPDGITRAELQRTAKNVLTYILKTKM